MIPTCSVCQDHHTPPFQEFQGTICTSCAAENLPCSVSVTRSHTDTDPARRRWNLKQLSQGPYSSSKDLYADISKIRKNERSNDGKRKRGDKYSVFRSRRHLKETNCDREDQILRTIQLNDSSLNSRLGRYHLSQSLGDHLLALGMGYAGVVLAGATNYGLPSSYTSYQAFRSEDNPKELSDLVEIWVSYALMLGVRWTYHSAILGTHYLPELPKQTLLDEPLDLRQQGYARYDIWMRLMQRSVHLAISPESPLLLRSDQNSLSVLFSMISSTNRLQPGLGKQLLRVAWVIFMKIWARRTLEDESGLLDSFKFIYIYDVSIHTTLNEIPLLTDNQIRNTLLDTKEEVGLYLDPTFLFIHKERLEASLPEIDDMPQWCLRRHIAFARDRIMRRSLSSEEAQDVCLKIMRIGTMFRLYREEDFQPIPQPEEIRDREAPIFTRPTGDEEFYVSVFTQAGETRNVLLTAGLLTSCREVFPENGAFEEMIGTWKLACDRQVHLICDLLAILLDRNEKLPRSLLEESFSARMATLFASALEYSNVYSLLDWSNRFPERKPLIQRCVKVLKHTSFLQKDTADQVTTFEAEAEATSTDCVFSQELRSPSPSIWDFSTTLGTMIASEIYL
ncbi:hypothetical protein BT69DRAFT_342385 [Atractiella rhizophila]|nr:hypothetical protein BT69DRAFT_342385 [Atractiella rhizophila]